MKLLSPIKIGDMQVKNRIVMSPMTTNYGNEDQTPSQRLIDFLVERARGGVGLITVEVCTVIVAGEPVADTALFDSVRSAGFSAHAVGDCTGLGLIVKAVHDAATVANAI